MTEKTESIEDKLRHIGWEKSADEVASLRTRLATVEAAYEASQAAAAAAMHAQAEAEAALLGLREAVRRMDEYGGCDHDVDNPCNACPGCDADQAAYAALTSSHALGTRLLAEAEERGAAKTATEIVAYIPHAATQPSPNRPWGSAVTSAVLAVLARVRAERREQGKAVRAAMRLVRGGGR